MSSNDYYEILGVPRNATETEIKERYRFLSNAFHPDKHSSEKHKLEGEREFKRINNAKEVLLDPKRRAEFDASYHSENEPQKSNQTHSPQDRQWQAPQTPPQQHDGRQSAEPCQDRKFGEGPAGRINENGFGKFSWDFFGYGINRPTYYGLIIVIAMVGRIIHTTSSAGSSGTDPYVFALIGITFAFGSRIFNAGLDSGWAAVIAGMTMASGGVLYNHSKCHIYAVLVAGLIFLYLFAFSCVAKEKRRPG